MYVFVILKIIQQMLYSKSQILTFKVMRSENIVHIFCSLFIAEPQIGSLEWVSSAS